MPTALTLLAEGFEEIEALAPVDLMRRAGVKVVTASLAPERRVTGRSGIVVEADTALADLGTTALFDLVFVPGGPGVRLLRSDGRVAELLRRHAAADRWIAAICAAPLVLHDACLLAGRAYTAHFSAAGELPAIRAHERVVTDGRITTSRGAGTSIDFGLHLVALLTSPEQAAEVSKAICC